MKKPKSQMTPNPWDRIKVKKGKMIGLLTDELSKNIMPIGGDGSSTKLTTIGNLGESKAYKQLPSKFR